jgi:parvulin-like peptidyl-prolyl isomerase
MSGVKSEKMHLAHILVEHKYEAEDLQRKLSAGGEFGELARKFSRCSSNSRGGDLGEIELHRLDDDFADAARTLAVGALSPVVRTRFGHHLIKRLG